jgi:hypothetical protein
MVRVFVSNLKVKGSNLMVGVMCGRQWYVDRIFFYRSPKIGAQVNYVAYLPRLSLKPRLGSDMCQ